MKASTVEVMPDIPDKPYDDVNKKKTDKYVKKAVKSQQKDQPGINKFSSI